MKEIEKLHKQFTDFNKSIVNKQLEAGEFVTDLTPRELNLERLISFEKRKSYSPNEKQDKFIEKNIERIELFLTNCDINFEKLNEYGRKKLTSLLIDSLEDTVARSLNASKKYVFKYKVISNKSKDGNYHTIPLRGDMFRNLIERLKNMGLCMILMGYFNGH